MKRILLALFLVFSVSSVYADETVVQSRQRLIEAYDFIIQNHVNDINTEEIVDNMIRTMTNRLDPYTKFLTPDRAQRHNDSLHKNNNIYVTSNFIDPIFYFHIKSFGEGMTDQFWDQFMELFNDHLNEFKGIVIDLRNNAGGLVIESSRLIDFFISNGLIVEKRGRKGSIRKKYASKRMLIPKTVPIVILINSQSASASEIVASALKDYNRATLLGTRTYGKGTVQSPHNFNNGSTIWVTTENYFTKGGANIDKVGINPDIYFVSFDTITDFSGNDSIVKKAIQIILQ